MSKMVSPLQKSKLLVLITSQKMNGLRFPHSANKKMRKQLFFYNLMYFVELLGRFHNKSDLPTYTNGCGIRIIDLPLFYKVLLILVPMTWFKWVNF